MSLYKKTHLKLVPPAAQAPDDGRLELSQALYQITLFPWSGHAVAVFFRFGREVKPGIPDPWALFIESMRGPQIDGLDLDNTLSRVGGVLITYREHIMNCLHTIVNDTYGGSFHIMRDYPARGGVIIL
jgi:hypothetical protein